MQTGSIVQSNREVEEHVAHRIKTYWLKLQNASGILCDRCIGTKLIRQFL